MIRVECAACHESFPMNDTARIEKQPLCLKCASADLSAMGNIAPDPASLRKQVDPTVCCGCGSDFGSAALPTLQSGLPVCESCRQAFLHRPFPNWVKLSFAALVAVAVVSLLVNWRFTAAYREMKKATREAQAGRIGAAAALLTSASLRVPESADLRDAAALYKGMHLLLSDKSTEALPYLREFGAKYPEQNVADLVYQAEVGAAFDRHDYDTFLAKEQQYLAQHAGDPMATAAVASAYACKYAVTGDPSFKTQSLQTLEHAKSLAGGKVEALK